MNTTKKLTIDVECDAAGCPTVALNMPLNTCPDGWRRVGVFGSELWFCPRHNNDIRLYVEPIKRPVQ